MLDPSGVRNPGHVGSSQPYARNLARHLLDILDKEGGRDSPAYNINVHPDDQAWMIIYYTAIPRNPSIQQNSQVIINTLKRLP